MKDNGLLHRRRLAEAGATARARSQRRHEEQWLAALEAHAANPVSWNTQEWRPADLQELTGRITDTALCE